MKKGPSIQRRLLVSITLLIAVLVGLGSVALYFKIKSSYFQETDAHLTKILNLLTPEIELVDGKVIQEWIEDSRDTPYRKKHDFIQTWNTENGETLRSPALGDSDLPQLHGKIGEFVFADITLPNGKRGRAVGVLTMPVIENEHVPPGTHPSASPAPVLAVTAIPTERSLQRFTKLRWILFLTVLALIASCSFIVSTIIRKSLEPIAVLSEKVSQKLPENITEGFQIPDQFPQELRELTHHYNRLLRRIARTRARERNFSANAAHELRTPLTGISITLEQALNRPRDTAYYQQCISETMEITQSMKTLVEHLMYFSRLQSDRLTVKPSPVDLHELLTTQWTSLEEQADRRELTVRWDLQAASATLLTDEHLVRILISNLLGNAVCYAASPSVITIHTHSNGEDFHLSISNATEGVTHEDVQRFFDPFFRVSTDRFTDGDHHGIGLALCQEIITVLDGDIEALLSEDGRLTIKVTLPVKSK